MRDVSFVSPQKKGGGNRVIYPRFIGGSGGIDRTLHHVFAGWYIITRKN